MDYAKRTRICSNIAKRDTETAIKLGVYFIICNSNCSDNYHDNSALASKLYYLGVKDAEFYRADTRDMAILEKARNKILASKNHRGDTSFYYKCIKALRY